MILYAGVVSQIKPDQDPESTERHRIRKSARRVVREITHVQLTRHAPRTLYHARARMLIMLLITCSYYMRVAGLTV
jgi:hypothetical protein